MSVHALAALSWEPQIKGALYVLIAVVVLPGSAYLLLTTNVGSRLGIQLAAAGLFGWMGVMGIIWWVYGIGLKGPAGEWKAKETVVGNVAAKGRGDELTRFPHGWKKVDLANPQVADAQPVADSVIVSAPGKSGMFKSSNDYIPLAAYEKGGKTYGPLGLDVRPFNVFHTPHYILLQVQKAVKPPAVAGQPPPRPVADPTAEPVSVTVVRNLGAVRLYPAVFALASLAIFGILCSNLHRWDRAAAARRAATGKT